MNKEELLKSAPKARSGKEDKKISYKKAFYIRTFLTNILTEDILLRRFGYRRLEETPDYLYSDIKKSLFSLKARLFHDRRKWENKRGPVVRRRAVYENNERIF
jgi:hypothetical protein